jgi:hypothetical protein
MKRSPFTKRKGRDGKIHEVWCAIFEGECCSCDDDSRKDPDTNDSGPLSGAPAAKKHLEEA